MLPGSITTWMRSQPTYRNGKNPRTESWLTGSPAGLQKTDDGSRTLNAGWLPDMDLNHDKQIQSLLCYRYTIGQTSVSKVERSARESRLVRALERHSVGAC